MDMQCRFHLSFLESSLVGLDDHACSSRKRRVKIFFERSIVRSHKCSLFDSSTRSKFPALCELLLEVLRS